MTQRVTKGHIKMMDGTHLLPMGKPIATAVAGGGGIEEFADSVKKGVRRM